MVPILLGHPPALQRLAVRPETQSTEQPNQGQPNPDHQTHKRPISNNSSQLWPNVSRPNPTSRSCRPPITAARQSSHPRPPMASQTETKTFRTTLQSMPGATPRPPANLTAASMINSATSSTPSPADTR